MSFDESINGSGDRWNLQVYILMYMLLFGL
jgi:hypothetical protein